MLSKHADVYVKQERRKEREEDRSDRPDHFGDVGSSRRDAFQ
jgi:hypothetical protein